MAWHENEAKIIREMIYKENELMNFRITWLVTIQGLLFAALSFANGNGNDLVPFLGLVGILVSVAALPPLYFSHHTIHLLRDDWDNNKSSSYNGPPIIGHYHKYDLADNLWSIISLWWSLPILFFGAWAWILITFCR